MHLFKRIYIFRCWLPAYINRSTFHTKLIVNIGCYNGSYHHRQPRGHYRFGYLRRHGANNWKTVEGNKGLLRTSLLIQALPRRLKSTEINERSSVDIEPRFGTTTCVSAVLYSGRGERRRKTRAKWSEWSERFLAIESLFGGDRGDEAERSRTNRVDTILCPFQKIKEKKWLAHDKETCGWYDSIGQYMEFIFAEVKLG